MTMSNQGNMGHGGHSSSGRFPLDNLTYDLVTILYEKSKGLEAYEKYQRDAQGNQEILSLLQQIRQQDEQHVMLLQQHLGHLMSSQGGTGSRAVGGSGSSGGSGSLGGSGSSGGRPS